MTRSTLAWMALIGAMAAVIPGVALADDPAMAKDGMLVDHKGMTLYTYDKDENGKSNCNEKCAANWPPLMAQGTSTAMDQWTVVKRDDGTMQWAYEGKPLYTFIKDKAGERTGDGVGSVWHVAKP